MLRPLFSQHTRKRDRCQNNGCNNAQPPEQRHNPHIPGNGLPRRQALVKPLHGVAFIARHQPIGQMRMDKFRPLIFGRRQIMRHRNHAQEKTRQTIRGNGRAQKSHRQYHQQLGLTQRVSRHYPAHQLIQQNHQHISTQQHHRKMADVHTRCVGDILGMRIPKRNPQHDHQPKKNSPERNALARCRICCI